MLRAMSDGDATLLFKNDMDGVSDSDLATDRDKIKTSVKELIEASGDLRYDLILEGGSTHAWVTELGSIAENGSFETFITDMLDNICTFDGTTVIYENKDASLDVKYNEYFKVNGAVVDTDYARYENAYVPNGKIERGAKVMTFEFEGYSLTLDFEAGTREE